MQTDKMQKKIPYMNNPKNKRDSILGVQVENQCVKGGGLLYGGFGLFIYGIFSCDSSSIVSNVCRSVCLSVGH